jgi:hypothetical protein
MNFDTLPPTLGDWGFTGFINHSYFSPWRCWRVSLSPVFLPIGEPGVLELWEGKRSCWSPWPMAPPQLCTVGKDGGRCGAGQFFFVDQCISSI